MLLGLQWTIDMISMSLCKLGYILLQGSYYLIKRKIFKITLNDMEECEKQNF